jgi:hypothetical protein
MACYPRLAYLDCWHSFAMRCFLSHADLIVGWFCRRQFSQKCRTTAMACFSSLSPSISLSFLCIWPPSPPGSAHTFVFGGLVKKSKRTRALHRVTKCGRFQIANLFLFSNIYSFLHWIFYSDLTGKCKHLFKFVPQWRAALDNKSKRGKVRELQRRRRRIWNKAELGENAAVGKLTGHKKEIIKFAGKKAMFLSTSARFDSCLKFSRLTTKFWENSRVSWLIRLIGKNDLSHYIDFSHYISNYTGLTSTG